MFEKTAAVNEVYPEAKFGYLIVDGLQGNSDRAEMNAMIAEELQQLKLAYPNYDRKQVLAAEPFCHYSAYYKKFKKTYHVLGQLESILLKEKSIPLVGPAVEAMFLAEVKHHLLTAGHDFAALEGPLIIDVAKTPLTYQGLSKKEQTIVSEDLYVSDQSGAITSIIKGPDFRTRITKDTEKALYFIYGVPGITKEQILGELQSIADYLTRVIPTVHVEQMKVI